jgi:hypothetical protein
MKRLSFTFELRRSTTLPKILLLIARLGGTVTHLSADERRVKLELKTPERAAHRFAPQIRRIVDVLHLAEGQSQSAVEMQPAESMMC